MDAEQVEFLISQYVDGTLAAGDREFVVALLERDSTARAMLADHRKLQTAVAALPAMPDLQWDRFADEVSRAVAVRFPEVGMTPSEREALDVSDSLPMPWVATRWRTAGRFAAIAAVLAVVFTVASHTLLNPTAPDIATRAPIVAEITGPTSEVAAGPATIEISIGAPAGLASMRRTDDGAVISRPSRVVIASGLVNVQDSPASPF